MIAVIGAAYVALPPLSGTAAVRRWVEGRLDAMTTYRIRFDELRVGYDLSLRLGAVSAAVPQRRPFLTARRVRMSLRPWDLLKRRVGKVSIETPRLFVDELPQATGGREEAVPSPPKEQEGTMSFPVSAIEIRDGFVHYTTGGREVAVGPLALSLDSLRTGETLELSGRSELWRGGVQVQWRAEVEREPLTLRGEVRSRVARLAEIATTLTGIDLPKPLREASATITVRFDGDARNAIETGLEAIVRVPERADAVELTGNGEFNAVTGIGSLRATLKPGSTLPVAQFSATVNTLEATPVLDLQADWSGVPVNALAKQMIDTAETDGTLGFELQVSGPVASLQGDGAVRLQGIRLRNGPWGVAGDVSLPFHFQLPTPRVELRDLQVRDVTGVAGDLEWKLATASIDAMVERDDGQGIRADATLSLTDLEFHDADYLRAAQAVSVRGMLQAKIDASDSLVVETDLSAPKGELLWDRVYLDLSQHLTTLRGQARGGMRASTNDQLAVQATLSVEDVGRATVDGSSHNGTPDPSWRVEIDVPDLSALYNLAVRDPLKESYPLLAGTKVHGQLSATVRHERDPSGSRIFGKVAVAEGEIVSTAPEMNVQGLAVDLPLDLRESTPVDEPPESAPQSGIIRAGSLRLGGVDVSGLALPLTVRPNFISITEPVRVSLLGGALIVTGFEVKRLDSAQREASFSVALHGLDLAGLSRAMGWPLLTGEIAGSIPNVTVNRNEIRSDGEIQAEIFGGRIRVRNLRVSQILSPVPTIELDLDFDELHLGQLTDTLEIGHISGVARGAVHQLAIVNGQPLGFEAWMETIPRSGVDQRVSVSAIRQLSILGGSGGDPLTQRILSFFDEYRYAKMGFHCSLQNDRFVLRGIEEFEGRQYLVVGSWLPPRVNVVSYNQTISFSEMVRRIGRAFVRRAES